MKTQLEKNAFHEAGHILLAYLTGYYCEKVSLNVNSDGGSLAIINYKSDALLIAGIVNYASDPEIFDELPDNSKKRLLPISNRIVSILLAGSITESIYLNDGKIAGDMEVEISGPDLLRTQSTDLLLGRRIRNHSTTFIDDKLRELFDFFILDEFWSTAKDYANATLSKNDYTLDQDEIEKIFTDNEFLDFIKAFQ